MPAQGRVAISDDCPGSYVVNELDIPVVVAGVASVAVVATEAGILVTSLEADEPIKELVAEVSAS